MRQASHPSFEQLVCSDPRVRRFADAQPLLRFWWKAILALHRGPVQHSASDVEVHAIIRSGYRWYLLLSMLLAPMAGAAAVFLRGWGTASRALAALACGLLAVAVWRGLRGLGSFRSGPVPSERGLADAMMCLTGALLALLIAMSIESPLHPVLSLVAATAVAAIGVGSLVIEIVYALPTTRTQSTDNNDG